MKRPLLASLLLGAVTCGTACGLLPMASQALELHETPALEIDVAAGRLPPIARRLPDDPEIVQYNGMQIGKPGGDLRMLISRARDVRMLSVYGYARLVGYDRNFEIKPDILKSIDVSEGRIFTMRLRTGHKWSDGHAFTSEDFRYYWEDVANNLELAPAGPPVDLLMDGEKPKVEILDSHTVRYSWSKQNPFFLSRLAAPLPLVIFQPAHYLKQFHKKYAEPEKLQAHAREMGARGWAEMHNKLNNMYEMDNPDLPTLEPWMITTRPPAIRFIAVRNPYFFRVDSSGQQLPYIDRVVMSQADGKLIPAKSGAGDVDLQARNIAFNNFTFLKENENRAGYRTLLWRTAKGSHVALFPNLNANDQVWRALMRDVRFRRALSLGIDREAVNQSLFFGLAVEGNNTILPDSPLFKDEYQKLWAEYDPKAANKLLDEIGLTKRDGDGNRLLPDGRVAEIIVETSGEEPEQTDVLELITESWGKIGIKLFVKPSQRDVMRNRIFSGEALMSVWGGIENGIANAEMSPGDLAPISQYGLEWPKWGQYFETHGMSGEKPDLPAGEELLHLYADWMVAQTHDQRETIWRRMLKIQAEQQFTIGIVGGVFQPVVANKKLRNVPEEGVYNFDPGAFFGVYRPDSFWFDR